MSASYFLRRVTNWALMALAATVLIVFAMPRYRQGEPSPAGKKAEDFVVTVEGRQARLSDFKGKVVVLNFWASWCGSCVEEVPDLNRLQERIRSRGGVVLGVSIDEDCRNFEHFLTEHPVAFRTTCDESLNEKVSLDYGTSGIPETYIIDRQGRIARKVIGPQRWDSAAMMEYFDSALARN